MAMIVYSHTLKVLCLYLDITRQYYHSLLTYNLMVLSGDSLSRLNFVEMLVTSRTVSEFA